VSVANADAVRELWSGPQIVRLISEFLGYYKNYSMRKGACGDLEELIMRAICSRMNESSGFDIRKDLAEKAGRKVSVGALYVVIDKLLEKDFLEVSRTVESGPDRGGRPQRLFRVTGTGQQAVNDKERERMGLLGGFVSVQGAQA
jgi:PadR family transcriptional regulator, regulatory protein PadR